MKHKLWETIRLASLGNGSCIVVLGGGGPSPRSLGTCPWRVQASLLTAARSPGKPGRGCCHGNGAVSWPEGRGFQGTSHSSTFIAGISPWGHSGVRTGKSPANKSPGDVPLQVAEGCLCLCVCVCVCAFACSCVCAFMCVFVCLSVHVCGVCARRLEWPCTHAAEGPPISLWGTSLLRDDFIRHLP